MPFCDLDKVSGHLVLEPLQDVTGDSLPPIGMCVLATTMRCTVVT